MKPAAENEYLLARQLLGLTEEELSPTAAQAVLNLIRLEVVTRGRAATIRWNSENLDEHLTRKIRAAVQRLKRLEKNRNV